MKIRPVGAILLHADGQRGMTKAIVAFRNFANAPKHGIWQEKKLNSTFGSIATRSITSTQILA